MPGGVASEYIKNIHVGDMISVAGPAGLFLEKKTPFKKMYMATGTGFAPIRSFIHSRSEKNVESVLFWGLKDLSEICLFDELLSVKNTQPSFSFYFCFSRQASFNGIPADLLQYFRMGHIDSVWSKEQPLIDPADEYYLCGSRMVIESLRTLLLSKGVIKDKLIFEKY